MKQSSDTAFNIVENMKNVVVNEIIGVNTDCGLRF